MSGEEKKRNPRGAGKKKGAKTGNTVIPFEILLTDAIWDELSEIAQKKGEKVRSAYVDAIVLGAMCNFWDYNFKVSELNNYELNQYLRLTSGKPRKGYVSLKKWHWNEFTKIMQKKGVGKTKLVKKMILSYLIKPEDQRPYLPTYNKSDPERNQNVN